MARARFAPSKANGSHVIHVCPLLSRSLYKLAMRLPVEPRHKKVERVDLRHNPKSVRHTDEQVMAAIRRVLAGEKQVHVARDIGAPIGNLQHWLSGENRGHLLDRVLAEPRQVLGNNTGDVTFFRHAKKFASARQVNASQRS